MPDPASEFGSVLPSLVAPPPGPRSRAFAERLRSVESRNVTYLSEDFRFFGRKRGVPTFVMWTETSM